MKLRWMWLLLLVTTGNLLIAGCGDPSAADPTPLSFFTPAEAAEQMQAIKNDAVSIANGLRDGVLNEASAGFPAYGALASTPSVFLAATPGVILLMQVPGESSPRAATGTFAFNEVWTYTSSPATHLVVRWTAEVPVAPAMELTVTSSNPDLVRLPDGAVVAAPKRTVLNVKRNGIVIADLTLDQAWRQTTCGLLGEARSIAVAGTAGNSAAGVTFRNFSVSSPVDGRWVMRGGVDVRSGSLTLALDPTIDFQAAVERNAATCMVEAMDDIDVSVDVKLTSVGRLARLLFGVAASQGATDVEFRSGRFSVGSKKMEFAGTMSGTMDLPSSLVLTFAAQELSTLAQFLERFGLLD